LLKRYAKLYLAYVRNCFVRLLDYRGEFFMQIFGWTMWTGLSLLFIYVVFAQVGELRGLTGETWTQADMIILNGTFAVMESLLHALVVPNFMQLSEQIRRGTLDVVLTKPASAQFQVSARFLHFGGVFNFILGCVVVAFGIHMRGGGVTWHGALLYVYLMLCGFFMAYGLWFLSVTLAFWFVRLDNIGFLFDPIMRVARFPMDVYPGKVRFIFMTVLPLGFLTTVPVQTLLGRAPLAVILTATLLASALLYLSSAFWKFALRRYESASS
jgi:ABC-2 type transport system permease protein